MEGLINIAMAINIGYFTNGSKVVTYTKTLKGKQSGLKIQSNNYFEIEEAFKKLRNNGIFLIKTNLNLVDILEITKGSHIVYNNLNSTELIIIK
jgi:hypothetical protein